MCLINSSQPALRLYYIRTIKSQAIKHRIYKCKSKNIYSSFCNSYRNRFRCLESLNYFTKKKGNLRPSIFRFMPTNNKKNVKLNYASPLVWNEILIVMSPWGILLYIYIRESLSMCKVYITKYHQSNVQKVTEITGYIF